MKSMKGMSSLLVVVVTVVTLLVAGPDGGLAQPSSATSGGGSSCSPVLSCSHIKALAQENLPSQYVNEMICIAYFESYWCPNAYNNDTAETSSYGLWQINETHIGAPGCPSTTEELLSPSQTLSALRPSSTAKD